VNLGAVTVNHFRFLSNQRRVSHIVKSGKGIVSDRGEKKIYIKEKRFIAI